MPSLGHLPGRGPRRPVLLKLRHKATRPKAGFGFDVASVPTKPLVAAIAGILMIQVIVIRSSLEDVLYTLCMLVGCPFAIKNVLSIKSMMNSIFICFRRSVLKVSKL